MSKRLQNLVLDTINQFMVYVAPPCKRCLDATVDKYHSRLHASVFLYNIYIIITTIFGFVFFLAWPERVAAPKPIECTAYKPDTIPRPWFEFSGNAARESTEQRYRYNSIVAASEPNRRHGHFSLSTHGGKDTPRRLKVA